jgi:superfamily II DNA or RNA helicase
MSTVYNPSPDDVKIVDLLPWSDPAPKQPLAIRVAHADSAFHRLYLDNVDAFRAADVTLEANVAKWRTSWEDYYLIHPRAFFQPEDLLPLYDYQQEHALILGQAFVNIHAVLDGSDTGTGKTPVSAVLCRELDLRPLVICKKSGMENWRRWLENLGVEPLGVWNYDKVKLNYAAPYAHCDKTSGLWTFELPENHVVVMDEVHKCSNKDTQNSALLVALKAAGKKILALSATAADSPMKLYALGYVLGLHVPRKTWTTFLERHGCQYQHGTGWEWRGEAEDMKALHKEIFPARGARMRKSEIPGYPKCQIVAESYDMGKDEERIRLLWEEHAEQFRILKEKSMYAEGAAKLIHALQLSELAKVQFLADEARELVEDGSSVAIAVRFTESRKLLMQKLKCGGIYGDQTEPERVEVIRKFQADIDRIVVVNMQAGSDSISLNDTHGNHPRVGLTCPTFSAIDLVQWFGRLNRANDKSPALYRLIYAKRTPEEGACRAVQAKMNNLSALNDGDLMAGVQLL